MALHLHLRLVAGVVYLLVFVDCQREVAGCLFVVEIDNELGVVCTPQLLRFQQLSHLLVPTAGGLEVVARQPIGPCVFGGCMHRRRGVGEGILLEHHHAEGLAGIVLGVPMNYIPHFVNIVVQDMVLNMPSLFLT